VKHAYLIMAHNEFGILEKLIKLLDCDNNDIYVHIDKKVKDFDFTKYEKSTEKANLFFVPRLKVNWGGYSQVRCELLLLKEAIKKEYDYYHLISGVDLPIKSNRFIDDFFEKNKGKEFIETDDNLHSEIYERIKYYHFFRELSGNNMSIFYFNRGKRNFYNRCLSFLSRTIIYFQKLFKINRIRANNLNIKRGTSWFSITNSFAKYLCENEKYIHKNFKLTSCADEIFLHTIVYQSKFKNSIINDCCRYIDWSRGSHCSPYTFRKEDYKSLMDSNKLWARKFSEKVDSEVVENIYETLISTNSHGSET